MHYLIMLHFRDGAGPQEGTPEFDAEMAALGRAERGDESGRRRWSPQAGSRSRPSRPSAAATATWP